MARVVLSKLGENVTVGGKSVYVIGTSAGEEVNVVSGHIVMDASFSAGGDKIVLPGDATQYTAQVEGSRVLFTNAELNISISIPIGPVANTISLADSAHDLVIDPVAGQVLLGGQVVDATPRPLTDAFGKDQESNSDTTPPSPAEDDSVTTPPAPAPPPIEEGNTPPPSPEEDTATPPPPPAEEDAETPPPPPEEAAEAPAPPDNPPPPPPPIDEDTDTATTPPPGEEDMGTQPPEEDNAPPPSAEEDATPSPAPPPAEEDIPAPPPAAGATNPLDAAWQPVPVGAGGYLTGIDVAPDGTIVVRTDTYGAYLLQEDGTWQQLITAGSMPGADLPGGTGVLEIQVADSNSDIMYMIYQGEVFRSESKGELWTKTSLPEFEQNPNDKFRGFGQKMAIDPNDPNAVFVGTQDDGVWFTRDGGETWAQHPSLSGAADLAGVTGIVFFGSENIYVSPSGDGVWLSTDGGNTFERLPGGPAGVEYAAVDAMGNYYAVGGSTEDSLWKYSPTTDSWSQIISGGGLHAVAVDPQDPQHVIVTSGGGNLMESKDGGLTWGEGWNWTTRLESSDDISWLESSGLYMTSGGLAFDPNVDGKVWQSAGVGVWNTVLPEKLGWDTPVNWTSQSVGIEQLVANDIIAPAGGDPVFASYDRPFFAINDLDAFSSTYDDGTGDIDFSMGWSVDYASSDHSFIVGVSDYWGKEYSGYSVDGGHTWQQFDGQPSSASETIGGSIAASTTQNFIWAPANGGTPAYTLDGGKTWHDVKLPEHDEAWSDFHFAYYLNRTTITADRVEPNTFYLYDASNGVYKTTDGGVSWVKGHDGQITDWSWYNAKIEAVPGSAGELYFTGGPQGDPNVNDNQLFMHSTDGGATWQAIAGVTEVLTFGFGAAKEEGGPASINIVGYVNGDYGIWQSDDSGQSWFQIGETPMGSLDTIKTISGDLDEYGQVYIGFGGSGFAYLPGELNPGNSPAEPQQAFASQEAEPLATADYDFASFPVGAPDMSWDTWVF